MQIRADECAVRMLRKYRLTSKRFDLGFEVATRLTRTVRRVRLARLVSHVDDGPSSSAPMIQQRAHAAFSVRIVSLSPAWIIDGVLHVDDDQRISRVLRHTHYLPR